MKNVSFSITVAVKNAIDSVKKQSIAFSDAKQEAEKASSTAGRLAGLCKILDVPRASAMAQSIDKIGSVLSSAHLKKFSAVR